jgi:spoIIIJ-associated protein
VISDSWRKDGFGMNGSIRVSAKTVEDAITEASIQLGITSDKLEYEVIEKGSAGFLGIGMKQAVIEARRKVEEKQETEIVEEVKKEIQQVAAEEVKAEEKIVEEVKAEIEHDEKPKQTTEKVEKKEEIKNDAPVKREVELAEVTDETKEAVSTFLKDTLKAMGMEVEIALDIDEDGSLSINMSGPNMGILIGKRGQTLDSLQYLANRVANKHQSGYVRVKLDTENYRARREETLKHLAKNIAHKVKRNRRPVALEPMNPYERRIIHSALQNDPYVTTHSEGEEPYRKVVVTLKK